MIDPTNPPEDPSVAIREGEHDVWAGLLGVAPDTLRNAIAQVGPETAQVRRFLGAPGGRTGWGSGSASAMKHLEDQAAAQPHPLEIAVATSEGADAPLSVVLPLLQLIKNRLETDVVFVSQFIDGKRVFRYVDVPPDARVISVGGADPLEESWCQRVVDGRLPQAMKDAGELQRRGDLPATPFPIGTHLSTPIVMGDGSVYGTLCCFSFAVSTRSADEDLKVLRAAAELLAERLEEFEARSR
jgi:GAF domain-containing protein